MPTFSLVYALPDPTALKLPRVTSEVTAHDFCIALPIQSIRFPSEQIFLLVQNLCTVPLYAPKATLKLKLKALGLQPGRNMAFLYHATTQDKESSDTGPVVLDSSTPGAGGKGGLGTSSCSWFALSWSQVRHRPQHGCREDL